MVFVEYKLGHFLMKISFTCVIRNDGLLIEGGLYKIVNKSNRHWYVGSTKINLAKRFRRHRGLLRKNRHPNNHLQNAYNKYGEDNFIFVILKHSRSNSFVKDEQKLIDCNLSNPDCYNISKDASSPMKGRKHSLQAILKIRKSVKKRSREIGENTRKHRTGQKHTSKTIKKMQVSAKKRDDSKRITVLKSTKVKDKISKATKGKKKSHQWKEKMNLIRQSSKYRKKMSLSTRGIKKSNEPGRVSN